jgi:hypothetical protein
MLAQQLYSNFLKTIFGQGEIGQEKTRKIGEV